MRSMFYRVGLKNINIENFDTSKVTNMEYMFYFCNNLTSLDVSSLDTSNVTSMYGMFGYNKGLTTLDLSSFNTSKVTNTEKMFDDDENLETIYVSNLWDVSNVTNSYEMFYNTKKLPNFNSRYIDKSRANTSETGYLTLKS